MKRKNIIALFILCIMSLCAFGCGSGNLDVDYDLTVQSGVTYAVGTELSENPYQSKYNNKVFRVRGKHRSSGDDYHYIVVKDNVCCDFEMEIRLADDSMTFPATNKNVIVVATYTRVPKTTNGGSTTFYLSVAKFE